ncbi:MAG: heavy metal-binding domain-containing protein [Candidatus Competibacterales bacterium]
MLYTTTALVEGKTVSQYLGVVTGETILGANIIKDIFASFSDFFGGRSATYERELQKARESAFADMDQEAQALGANAIIGIDIDYETVGSRGGMLMVTVSGTAVVLR